MQYNSESINLDQRSRTIATNLQDTSVLYLENELIFKKKNQ